MMDTPARSMAALFLVVMLLCAASPAMATASGLPGGQRWQPTTSDPPITSEPELKAVIERLGNSDTRLDALGTLIRFASPRLFQGGSMSASCIDGLDGLRDEAVAAIRACADEATVGRALDSGDCDVQVWALWNWRANGDMSDDAVLTAWSELTPKVERLAISGDETVRAWAVERLAQCPVERAFLDSRIPVETSAWVVERLVRADSRAERMRRLNVQMVRLLSSLDKSSRYSALVLVGANTIAAPVCQLEFDLPVFDEVVRLTYSSSDEERSNAAFALTAIRPLDPNRSRAVFIRLSTDPSSDVRYRVALALAGELERDDVRPVIDALLDDPSPLVEFMTILAVDPRKYADKLERLAHGADAQVAAWATVTLEQLKDPNWRPAPLR